MNEEQLEEVLDKLSDILGPYTGELVLGGGLALILYRYYLVSIGETHIHPAYTKDFDFIIERHLTLSGDDLHQRLTKASFIQTTQSHETPPVESYIGTLSNNEIAVEFLTDRKKRLDPDKNVLVAGVSAQPLSYIEMSRGEAIEIRTKNSKTFLVVAPAAWIFHKALTFTRRKSQDKRCKDLYGIWYASSQLGNVSHQANSNLINLMKKQPQSWSKDARKNLLNWTKQASPSNWQLLEAQDPERVLTKEKFLLLIEEILPLTKSGRPIP